MINATQPHNRDALKHSDIGTVEDTDHDKEVHF